MNCSIKGVCIESYVKLKFQPSSKKVIAFEVSEPSLLDQTHYLHKDYKNHFFLKILVYYKL